MHPRIWNIIYQLWNCEYSCCIFEYSTFINDPNESILTYVCNNNSIIYSFLYGRRKRSFCIPQCPSNYLKIKTLAKHLFCNPNNNFSFLVTHSCLACQPKSNAESQFSFVRNIWFSTLYFFYVNIWRDHVTLIRWMPYDWAFEVVEAKWPFVVA